jgi:hypothetical protein
MFISSQSFSVLLFNLNLLIMYPSHSFLITSYHFHYYTASHTLLLSIQQYSLVTYSKSPNVIQLNSSFNHQKTLHSHKLCDHQNQHAHVSKNALPVYNNYTHAIPNDTKSPNIIQLNSSFNHQKPLHSHKLCDHQNHDIHMYLPVYNNYTNAIPNDTTFL